MNLLSLHYYEGAVNPEGSAQLVRFGDFILEVASSSPLRATGGFPGR